MQVYLRFRHIWVLPWRNDGLLLPLSGYWVGAVNILQGYEGAAPIHPHYYLIMKLRWWQRCLSENCCVFIWQEKMISCQNSPSFFPGICATYNLLLWSHLMDLSLLSLLCWTMFTMRLRMADILKSLFSILWENFSLWELQNVKKSWSQRDYNAF